MAPYKYRKLDLDRPSIRLLKLFEENFMEGNFGDYIKCELIDGYIEEGIPYDALSYTWGTTEKEASIVVDGCSMKVTLNVFEALQQIRSRGGSQYLWIDAICINQNKSQERGHQVQQMGLIYQRAERVLIWLGQGTMETDFVMDFMKTLHDIFVKEDGDWKRSAQFWIDACPARCSEGMKLILDRPWFRRIWILQEVAHARIATILCGKKSVSASTFTRVPALLKLRPSQHCQAVLDIMPGPSRRTSWWNGKRDLYTLLTKFGESQATDERDMIYALLGISSDACKALLLDYKKPLYQLIRETTIFLLFHTNESSLHYILPDWTWREFLRNLHAVGDIMFSNATMDGHETILKLLLVTGHIDSENSNDRTPLALAAGKGDEVMVRQLLASGKVGVDLKNGKGQTPLFWAAQNGHDAVVRQLLKTGKVEVDLMDKGHRTPLSLAAEKGHEGVVRELLATGKVDVNSRGKKGQTPLLCAAGNSHVAVVRQLLATGKVDFSCKNNCQAIKKGNKAVKKVLHEHQLEIERSPPAQEEKI